MIMLKLRFIEINKDDLSVANIDPALITVIGHQGQVKPKITNGHISRKHCTVSYDATMDQWVIDDGGGDDHKFSRNGLFTRDGSRVDRCAVINCAGIRIYLLSLGDCQAYLESYDTEVSTGRDTQSLENRPSIPSERSENVARNINIVRGELVNSHNKMTEVKEAIGNNLAGIEKLSGQGDSIESKLDAIFDAMDKGLTRVETIGSKPRAFIVGSILAIVMSLSTIGLIYVNNNVDYLVDVYLQHKGYSPKPRDK